jgi:hypothetical protein
VQVAPLLAEDRNLRFWTGEIPFGTKFMQIIARTKATTTTATATTTKSKFIARTKATTTTTTATATKTAKNECVRVAWKTITKKK